MARQSATQHIDIVFEANLVTVVRRGRERVHYLNPVPIHEIGARWVSRFEEPRLDAHLTARYWGHANVSDWAQGSTWEHRRTDDSGIVDVGGTVIETKPPKRLFITFGAPGEAAEDQSLATSSFFSRPAMSCPNPHGRSSRRFGGP